MANLEEQYLALEKYFETTSNPTLEKLDEYIAISIEYYQKETRRGGEGHEEAWQTVNRLKKVTSGSYRQEKRLFCLASQQAALDFVEKFKREGKKELTRQNQAEADNWGKLAQACQDV